MRRVRSRTYTIRGETVEMHFRRAANWDGYGKVESKHVSDGKRRIALLMLLGSACECGESDFRCLQVDHVHGGGCHERQLQGHKSYGIANAWQGALSGHYQILCANCNWKKRYEQNEHRLQIAV